MADDCIFCRIVDGEIPSRTVYEDDEVTAFLDANPLAPGHTLVIPTDHHRRLNDLSADVARSVFEAVHALVDPVEAAVDADATTVAFNNGEAAGQAVDHVHCHVVPRFEGDGGGSTHSILRGEADLSDDELDGIAADIGDRVR